MTISPESDTIYVIGGWGTDTQCSVYRIQLPSDLCSLWPGRQCLDVLGCGYCALTDYNNVTLSETCHNFTRNCPLSSSCK